MNQISLFDGNEHYKIDKPIRLIELFAGYGSQHLALKYLGVGVDSWKICEWAIKSIQAYKDLHFGADNTDYSANLSQAEIIDYLTNKGISADYNKPMSREQIKRMGESKCRSVYNNIISTHNQVNIMQTHASDLEIIDTDKYCYIMTYSFPCQDLSKAGQQKGMAKDSGTRSGLLWEVERILDECNGNLPQVLVMENVPDVIGSKNIEHFVKWLQKLESLGYYCKWQVMNAKDYGIPQNRKRCFMVSILQNNVYYNFPKKQPLELRLKDMLETKVDEKYYLSSDIDGTRLSRFRKSRDDCRNREKMKDEIKCECKGLLSGDKWDKMHEQSRRCYDTNGLAPTIHTCEGGNLEPKIIDDTYGFESEPRIYSDCPTIRADRQGLKVREPIVYDIYNKKQLKNGICGTLTCRGNTSATTCGTFGVVEQKQGYRIRKLTEKECFRLMGVHDDDFEKISKNQSKSSMYHLAGDSIVTNCLMVIFGEML